MTAKVVCISATIVEIHKSVTRLVMGSILLQVSRVRGATPCIEVKIAGKTVTMTDTRPWEMKTISGENVTMSAHLEPEWETGKCRC